MFRLGSLIMAAISVVLSTVIIAFGKTLLSIFGLGAEAVSIGERFFKTIAMFYIFNGLSMSIRGYLEGISGQSAYGGST
ncbi:MAG: MATE family efflux transporter [Eubacteriales bacterium]|nr:MATE family efflux transporter [Eubacteriales bacterium]